MKLLKINNKISTVVDDECYEKFKKFKWRLSKFGYIVRGGGNKLIFLHREICETPDGYITDHINGNKLDNLRSNLRICLNNENLYNSGIRSDNNSGYKGVSWRKDRKKWTAEIAKEGNRYRLGCYLDLKSAVMAYNTKAKELFGQYARLNEIPK